jgi:type II secretory pathway component PulF
MPEVFVYTAKTRAGEKRTGLIQSDSASRVALILGEQELIPIEIKSKGRTFKPGIFGFLKGQQYEDLIMFTRNLATLYKAGIPLLRALSVIKVGPPGGNFNGAIYKIRDHVQAGRSLSDAMSDYPKIFSKIYTASVAAGEASGKLDDILDSLGAMLERDLELKRQIKIAVRYPIMVVIAIAIAFTIMITFVIPRFVTFYSGAGAQLPVPTKLLIWMNQFITHYWMLIIGGIIVFIFVLRKFYATDHGRTFFDTIILKLPVFGDLVVKGNIARFAYMFQLLMKSGIPIVKSLDLLADTVKNSRITAEIKIIAESFKEGRELTGIIDKLVFFPEMALQMISIGLESGSMENMLLEVANHYGKEVDYKSRHLTSLLEPILTIVLGAFVLVVALAIFLPMWNLIQVFRQ